MTTILAYGRKLPHNDWEGDDFTPGAGGRYVTCMDTASGRMVAWATNGRINQDGKWYRQAVSPPDPNGITFDQAAQAVHSRTGLPLHHDADWTRSMVTDWLKQGKGLIITGIYATIPRQYRYQLSSDFGHAMFVVNISKAGVSRLYDPLDPNTSGHGRNVPSSILWPFLASREYTVGYVPLQHL